MLLIIYNCVLMLCLSLLCVILRMPLPLASTMFFLFVCFVFFQNCTVLFVGLDKALFNSKLGECWALAEICTLLCHIVVKYGYYYCATIQTG